MYTKHPCLSTRLRTTASLPAFSWRHRSVDDPLPSAHLPVSYLCKGRVFYHFGIANPVSGEPTDPRFYLLLWLSGVSGRGNLSTGELCMWADFQSGANKSVRSTLALGASFAWRNMPLTASKKHHDRLRKSPWKKGKILYFWTKVSFHTFTEYYK